jgi:hypothetical protein
MKSLSTKANERDECDVMANDYYGKMNCDGEKEISRFLFSKFSFSLFMLKGKEK